MIINPHDLKSNQQWLWMEEFKHCSCTFIAAKRSELMGYCPRHANDRKYVRRLPMPKNTELGYAG